MSAHTRASARYGVRFAASMGSYGILLVIGIVWFNLLPADDPVRFVAVALPLPALVAVVWAVFRFVVESDEMLSRDTVRALAVGFAGGSLITFTYGLFQIAGAPVINWMWVWPVYAVCWALGGALVRASGR